MESPQKDSDLRGHQPSAVLEKGKEVGSSCPRDVYFPACTWESRLTNARAASAYLTPTDHRMPLTTERYGVATLQAAASEDRLSAMGTGAEVSIRPSYSSLHADLSSETGEIRVWHAHLRPRGLGFFTAYIHTRTGLCTHVDGHSTVRESELM